MAIGMLKDLANVEKFAVAQAHLGAIYADLVLQRTSALL